jgi:Na+/H+ antiporter NhaD/arsenite permease-like protein
MATFLFFCTILYIATIPLRRAQRRSQQTAANPVVVVVQIPAPPQAPMTIEQEWAHIQTRAFTLN